VKWDKEIILNNQLMEIFEGNGHYIFMIISPAGAEKSHKYLQGR
jgi:hypothetical protein